MSSKVLGPEATREMLLDRADWLDSQPDFQEPTPEMYGNYALSLSAAGAIGSIKNRGKHEIAIHLNMTVTELEGLFIGKSVLDIGCGQGRLSEEVARLKKTKVKALDHDPEVLSKVKTSKNLEAVEGSAFEIQDALGDEEFDVVVSAYSGNHWARNGEQKKKAITSALRATKVGGTALIIPVSSNIEHREASRKALKVGRIRGFERKIAKAEDIKFHQEIQAVYDWLEVLTIDTLLAEEERGAAECTFVSSSDNDRGIPIMNIYNKASDPRQESYSAMINVLSH